MEDPMMQQAPGGPPMDDPMAAEAERGAAMKGEIGASAPQPTKPYTIKTLTGLVEQFDETLDALGGQDLPNLPWDPPKDSPRWEQPIPAEIYAPLYALKQAVSQVAGGKFASKYTIDCESMTDDTQVRKITGILGKMAKDKELSKAMQEPMTAPQAPPPRTPAPSEFSQQDADLMGNM